MNNSRRSRRKTSADEFSNMVREQAGMVMRAMFHREAEGDPLLEFITCLLEDGAGGMIPTTDEVVTTDQWHTWNRLVLNQTDLVTRMLTRELERERPAMPAEPEAMRRWAATLLLATLDRLGMK